MKRLLMVAAGALVWGSMTISAQAAPIAPADVASGAKWLVHIDLDAARTSKVGTHFRDKIVNVENVKARLEKLHDEFGIDPLKDLHGATIYGTDLAKPDTAVIVVHAACDKEKLLSFLKTRPGFAESKDGDHDLYTWTQKTGRGADHAVWASFPKAGAAVLADSADGLKAALEVIGGKGGLATSSPLLSDAPKGTIIRGAVVGLTTAKLPTQLPPLAKQIDGVNIAIGENDGEDFVHIKVAATGADAVKQMKSMIDGFRGLIGLHAADQPDLQKMLDSLKVESQGTDLTVDWKVASDELIKLGEKAQKGAHRSR